jgi:DNA mismatch repair protein MutS
LKIKNNKKKPTPLMSQYNSIKEKHPDALLLFRVGDFYETFGDDAIITSSILDIVLTNRSNGSSKIELAGFPHHALDNHLPKLVRAGKRVAICDQLEDPKTVKGIVRRGVTELVTPGVSYHDIVLEKRQNNFLGSISYSSDNSVVGLSLLDISTGEFLIAEGVISYISKLIQSFQPKEIIFQKNKEINIKKDFEIHSHVFMLDEWIFKSEYSLDLLQKQFKTKSLKGFGIEKIKEGIKAAGAILHYLNETHHNCTDHILSISRIDKDQYVWMDSFTIRNLELFNSTYEKGISFIDVLDKTQSPMGSRLLRRWVALPLKDVNQIKYRQDIVYELIQNQNISDVLRENLFNIGDLERLVSKISTLRINPREVEKLKEALCSILIIKECFIKSSNSILKDIADRLHSCKQLISKIEKELNDTPPISIHKGDVIKNGVDSELDELREIKISGKRYLNELLNRESERTNIPSLKISFNNVFGYYLEVRNTHKDKVPDEWIRKQTLVNAERYITEELKEYEQKILSSEEKIYIIENRLYTELVESISLYIKEMQANSQLVAQLDCLLSFSDLAQKYDYNKPNISRSNNLIIKNGRHPVIERQLSDGEDYVPNDLLLDNSRQQIMMITGPNMSGKSAILRQTALIVIMAQIGSFIPAESADIGVIDKIFTRVGAADNISMGESTFMVEMHETASILNNLSENSLILLDEIGRGTSTYDGISIAWSIAEYLHNHATKPKTLFATHYHELNDMQSKFTRIKNYNVAVKESGKDILFIRTLKEGGSEHSFGIHVAKIAGMPFEIVKNSRKILKELESMRNDKTNSSKGGDMQLSVFKLDDPVLEEIRDEIADLDIDTLQPIEALLKLNEIKKIIGK